MALKLRYKVSEEIYLEMLEMQIKRKNRSPLILLLTFLFTVGQLGFLAYLIIGKYATGQTLYYLIPMAILAVCLTIFYHVSTKRRAKVTLGNFKYAKKIPEDFWKEHELTIDKFMTVRFGGLKSKYNFSSITGYEELPSAFLLYCNGTVADIVPFSAIPDKQAFIDLIADTKKEVTKAIDEAYKASVPDEYKYSFSYSYTMDKYVKQQQEAYRRAYTTKGMYKFNFFIKLLITLYAAGYIFMRPEPLMIAACVALIIFMNLQHIATFSPISAITIKRGIAPIAKKATDKNATVYVTSTHVVVRSTAQSLDVPIADIKAMRRVRGGVALYLNKAALLTISEPISDEDGNYANFVKFMNYKVN